MEPVEEPKVIMTCRNIGEAEIGGELRNNFMCSDPLAENIQNGDAIDLIGEDGNIERFVNGEGQPANVWSFFSKVRNTFGL